MMNQSPTPRMGMAKRKTVERAGLREMENTSAQTSMKGARTATRTSIWYAFWTLDTSVVSRVTRLAAENLSMLVNEKS